MNIPGFAFLPNLISLGRLILVPLSVEMIASQRWLDAFAVFLIAGASDAVDGWLARTFDLRSELGAYLDAIADKALLISIYVSLALVGVVPAAIAILVVSRDLMIMGAVLLARLVDRPLEIKPLLISKFNTSAQIGVAAAILAAKAFDLPLAFWFLACLWIVAALTLASAAAYLKIWIAHMSAD